MQLKSHIVQTLSVAGLTIFTLGLSTFSQTTFAADGEERILHEQQIVTAGDNTPELVQDLQDALGELGPDYEARTVHWVDADKPAFLNRLILEDSPYLIQHAHNPVNWYPWGQEAFDKAVAEDKPIFLSIGYATCHWCHVMERESFESKEIADYLNEHFVTIKVDREQRPDVDASYMSAVQIMTGSGGWPMSSFLTTETKPFYGGTYYPPDVFTDLLKQIVGVWNQGRDSIEAQADELSAAVVTSSQLAGEAMEVGSLVIDKAVADIVSSYDDMQGGFGGAPKFPQESKLFLLLDYARRTGNEAALEAAHFSLQRMAAGGIHDQVAGGFHRYAVDNDWLIPHFEKMLYNQALLARNYLTAYTVNGDPEHRRTLTRLLDYVLREMLAPEGGFYSATDADSEGEEGTFFIWTPEELSSVLNDEELNFAQAFWNVTERGNFEHSNILHSTGSLRDESGEFDMSYDEFVTRVDAISAKLLAARQSREKPLRDDKLITAWNGMMITALAEAGDLLENQKYTDAALTAANFVWQNSRSSGGQLWRAYYNGSASVEAAQEDYAYLAESFIRLYDSTGDGKWLTRAETLAATMHDTFWDNEGGGYFLGTEIVGAVRPKNLYDTSIPSGNAVALGVLTRLWHRTGKDLYKQRADAQVVAFSSFLQSFPSAFAYMLKSTSELLSGESGHRFFAARGNVKIDARKHEDEVRVEIAMSEGWHLNSNKPNQDYLIPTRLMSEDGKDLSSTEYPDSITKILSFSTGEELALYEDNVVITAALAEVKTKNNTQLIPLTLQLQACDDTVCLPPETVSFSLSLAQ